jgi:hypothetical protein
LLIRSWGYVKRERIIIDGIRFGERNLLELIVNRTERYWTLTKERLTKKGRSSRKKQRFDFKRSIKLWDGIRKKEECFWEQINEHYIAYIIKLIKNE